METWQLLHITETTSMAIRVEGAGRRSEWLDRRALDEDIEPPRTRTLIGGARSRKRPPKRQGADHGKEQTMLFLIADDQEDVRAALRLLLLEQETGCTVVEEASDAISLLSSARRTKPDLLLIDWELPGMKPAETLLAFRGLCPEVPVIALSGRIEAGRKAREEGVDAFVGKGEPPENLVTAIRTVGRKS